LLEGIKFVILAKVKKERKSFGLDNFKILIDNVGIFNKTF